MMRSFAILGFVVLCLPCFADDSFITRIPDGHFAGSGTWQDNRGNVGEYQSYVEFKDNTMRVDYDWADGRLTTIISFSFDRPGEFQVLYQGNIVGTGSCEESSCQYEISASGSHFAESLIFGIGPNNRPSLSKIGHKEQGDHVISWDDKLTQLNL